MCVFCLMNHFILYPEQQLGPDLCEHQAAQSLNEERCLKDQGQMLGAAWCHYLEVCQVQKVTIPWRICLPDAQSHEHLIKAIRVNGKIDLSLIDSKQFFERNRLDQGCI